MMILNYKKTRSFLIALTSLIIIGLHSASYADSYLVIVNANNSFSADEKETKNTIKRMYLKEMSSWPGGGKTKAVARGEDSKEHQAFMKNILGMSNANIAGHWMSLKQKTGETPPRAIKSTKSVVKLVSKKTGAFSYISEADSNSLSAKVKVLFKY